jgi:glutamate formiminotransferase/glutamate formiminotransferase/formiminotetrahydrofolate cyclodeaminase
LSAAAICSSDPVTPTLLAVPNVSEGRDPSQIESLAATFSRGATLLDRHSDPDHDRTVFTLAASPAPLREALLSGAEQAIETVDMAAYDGQHPAVGALDVCPVVWIDPADQTVARTEALTVAEQIGGLGVPVFLYGEMATQPEHAERAYFRNGGLAELWLRMEGGELQPDHGPGLPHRTAGVTLVTARPPLAAFNVELDSKDLEVARAVAAGLRESGGGLAGVRAMGLMLSGGRTQVSTNVHDPFALPLREVVNRVRVLAAKLDARPVEAEIVGLVPAAALSAFPTDLPIRDFDPAAQTIEARLPAAS